MKVKPRGAGGAGVWARALACAAVLGGCIGGQTGQEDSAERPLPQCQFDRIALAADTPTRRGFSAAQVEARFAEPITTSMQWHRMNSRSELTLKLLEVQARFFNASTDGVCGDSVGLDALVSIESADGLLDERLQAVIEADAFDEANIVTAVATDAISGQLTAELLDLDLRAWRDPMLSFRLTQRTASGLSGQITLDGSDPTPGDDSVVASPAIAELPAP